MQRQFNLDFGRALAISLVTAFHVWRFYGEPHGLISPIIASGYVGVDLFFVISGYSMMLTSRNHCANGSFRAIGFWAARLSRIYPAYVVAIVFWAIMMGHGAATKPIGSWDIAAHLLMLHTLFPDTFFSVSGVLWSLAVEAHFYCLFPLLVLASRRLRLSLAALSLIFSVMLEILLSGESGIAAYPIKWNVLTFLPLFILGMEMHSPAPWLAASIRRWATVIGALVLVLMWTSQLLAGSPYPVKPELMMLSRLLIGAGLGAICLHAIPRDAPNGLASKMIGLVGFSSYSIYLYNYVFYITGTPIAPGSYGPIITFCGVVTFGICMWWLIERPIEAFRKRALTPYFQINHRTSREGASGN